MVAHADKPELFFETADDWERWLDSETADRPDAVRLRLRKTGSSAPGMLHAEALQVALCFGWIDGQAGPVDDDYFTVGFSVRRPRSLWSQRNREYVERLIAEGRMRPAGHREIERAKADGRWDAAYRQATTAVPADLRAALDANPAAAAVFESLTAQNRFSVIFRIDNVKRATTRAAKIAGFVESLARGETPHPQKKGIPPTP